MNHRPNPFLGKGKRHCKQRLIGGRAGRAQTAHSSIWMAQMRRLVLSMAGALQLASQDASRSVCQSDPVAWIAPEALDHACLASNRSNEITKPCIQKVKFWRLRVDSARGDWHLYNEEDKDFLQQTAHRIAAGQYYNSKLEWTTLTGSLPK